jgi:hypothetical protein
MYIYVQELKQEHQKNYDLWGIRPVIQDDPFLKKAHLLRQVLSKRYQTLLHPLLHVCFSLFSYSYPLYYTTNVTHFAPRLLHTLTLLQMKDDVEAHEIEAAKLRRPVGVKRCSYKEMFL